MALRAPQARCVVSVSCPGYLLLTDVGAMPSAARGVGSGEGAALPYFEGT